MPSIDRPNAPKRLPSGVLNSSLFGRKHWDNVFASSSNAAIATTPSPSPISPFTVTSPLRGPSSPGHRKYISEESPKSSILLSPDGISNSKALDSIAPGVRRGSTILPSKPSRESSASDPSSTRSSISQKARKWFNLPSMLAGSGPNQEEPPSHEPKKGFHWHREISGHWLEIRIGRKPSRSEETKAHSSGVITAKPSMSNPPSVVPKGAPQRSSRIHSNVHGTPSTPLKHPSKALTSAPPTPGARDGLVEKTKRRLGIKRNISDESSFYLGPRTKTGEMLERTSSRLRLVATNQSLISTNSVSNRDSNGPSVQKAAATEATKCQRIRGEYGKREAYSTLPSSRESTLSAKTQTSWAIGPKWQRIRGEHGLPDTSSSSSKISVMLGGGQLPTPDAQEMYVGSDQQQYFRVEMTDADAPNFLPSEARRVNTPPIGKAKVRGFFFDYKPPAQEDKPFKTRLSWQATSSDAFSEAGEERPRRISTSEWYNVQLDVIDAEESERVKFVNEVPDHLPNSPMCPKHPKHKSGGKGTCPMHGRRETQGSTDGTGDEQLAKYLHNY